jgi:hypothetical protein
VCACARVRAPSSARERARGTGSASKRKYQMRPISFMMSDIKSLEHPTLKVNKCLIRYFLCIGAKDKGLFLSSYTSSVYFRALILRPHSRTLLSNSLDLCPRVRTDLFRSPPPLYPTLPRPLPRSPHPPPTPPTPPTPHTPRHQLIN